MAKRKVLRRDITAKTNNEPKRLTWPIYNDVDKEHHEYKEQVYPLRTSDYYNREHEVDLLENQHYCIITNFSRLISTKHQKTKKILV